MPNSLKTEQISYCIELNNIHEKKTHLQKTKLCALDTLSKIPKGEKATCVYRWLIHM